MIEASRSCSCLGELGLIESILEGNKGAASMAIHLHHVSKAQELYRVRKQVKR